MAFRKLFFKRVQGIRDNYLLQEGDIALDEDDFKLYRGDGSTTGGVVIAGAGGGSGIALTDISVTQASASGAGTLAYNSSTGVFTYTPPTASGLGAKTSVSQADVTQHQSALSITESQISDFGTYLTSVPAQSFASLTGKPTTLSGYGITDALTTGSALTGSGLEPTAITAPGTNGTDLTLTGGDASGANSDGGDAIITGGDGANTLGALDGNVLIGTTQTTLVTIGSGSNNVDFPNGTAVDFTGATVTGLPAAYSDSDVDTHLNTGSAGTNEVLSWTGSDYDWVAQSGGGSSLQSRATKAGTTGSLADAAQENLDITGFKGYALLKVQTDRAARVRIYTDAASRTADASRAEGTDPTSDAGVIAEVITAGAETVLISPGAFGFNNESTPTTTIPCRVTNKSGGTSTVVVTLHVLQLES